MTSRRPAMGFIFVTVCLDMLGVGLILPILPKLIEHFKGGNTSDAAFIFGWFTAIYALMQFLFAPLLGSLSDRFGRRPVLLVSLFGSALDYFFLAFAPNLVWFFIGRTFAGITGANMSTAHAYIADISPPEKRAANFGMMGAAFGVGFVAGPLVGGILGDMDLRLPFIAAGTLSLLNWFYGLFVLPESLGKENRRHFSWARSNPIGALLDLKRYPVVLGLMGTFFLMCLGQQALISIWVLYTGYRYEWTPLETGFSLAVIGITGAIVQVFLTKILIRKFGEEKSVLIGLLAGTLAYIGYGLASQGWIMYVVLAASSPAWITGPSLQGLISRSVRANEQGGVSGTLSSLGSVAGFFAPILATPLFSYSIGPRIPVKQPGLTLFMSALVTAIALFLAFRCFRKNSRFHQAVGPGITSLEKPKAETSPVNEILPT